MGEKLAALRKRKKITQEQLSEILKVSRQSVSRWEMDVAFPETDKLIKLSKLLECSIDFLLNDDMQESMENDQEISVNDCFRFMRECGYFFLATSVDNKPALRPMGMIYSDGKALFIVTDKQKNVYLDLCRNPLVELAGYNPNGHKWLRISGRAEADSSLRVREEIMDFYPMLRQKYMEEEETFLAVFKIRIENISMD